MLHKLRSICICHRLTSRLENKRQPNKNVGYRPQCNPNSPRNVARKPMHTSKTLIHWGSRSSYGSVIEATQRWRTSTSRGSCLHVRSNDPRRRDVQNTCVLVNTMTSLSHDWARIMWGPARGRQQGRGASLLSCMHHHTSSLHLNID